jgi:hypothetical protein
MYMELIYQLHYNKETLYGYLKRDDDSPVGI